MDDQVAALQVHAGLRTQQAMGIGNDADAHAGFFLRAKRPA